MSKIVSVRARLSGQEVSEAWVGCTVDGTTGLVDETARVVIPGKLDRLTNGTVADVSCVWLEADGSYTVDTQ